jgi:hypothetical protein
MIKKPTKEGEKERKKENSRKFLSQTVDKEKIYMVR